MSWANVTTMEHACNTHVTTSTPPKMALFQVTDFLRKSPPYFYPNSDPAPTTCFSVRGQSLDKKRRQRSGLEEKSFLEIIYLIISINISKREKHNTTQKKRREEVQLVCTIIV
jgi:hypothetical protein